MFRTATERFPGSTGGFSGSTDRFPGSTDRFPGPTDRFPGPTAGFPLPMGFLFMAPCLERSSYALADRKAGLPANARGL